MQPYREIETLVFYLCFLLSGVKAQSPDEFTIIVSCAVVGAVFIILILVTAVCIARFLKKRQRDRSQEGVDNRDYADLIREVPRSRYECLDPDGRLPETATVSDENPVSQESQSSETRTASNGHKELIRGNPGLRFEIVPENEIASTSEAVANENLKPARPPRTDVEKRNHKQKELVLFTASSQLVIVNENDCVVRSLTKSQHQRSADNKAFSMEDNSGQTAPPRPPKPAVLQKQNGCQNPEQPADQGVKIVSLNV